MGKITVKHYLEKKVKTKVYSNIEEGYSLYVRITINRKTTQIKSLTNIVMTEKAFNIYLTNNEILNYEINYTNNKPHNLNLLNEISLITKSIETILKFHKGNYDLSEYSIREHIESLLIDVETAFINIGWTIEAIGNPIIDLFCHSFNKERALLYNLQIIKEVANIDLSKFLPERFFKVWQVIEIIRFTTKNKITFIEYIDNFNINDLTKGNEYFNFDISESEFLTIYNYMIERYFIFNLQ